MRIRPSSSQRRFGRFPTLFDVSSRLRGESSRRRLQLFQRPVPSQRVDEIRHQPIAIVLALILHRTRRLRLPRRRRRRRRVVVSTFRLSTRLPRRKQPRRHRALDSISTSLDDARDDDVRAVPRSPRVARPRSVASRCASREERAASSIRGTARACCSLHFADHDSSRTPSGRPSPVCRV